MMSPGEGGGAAGKYNELGDTLLIGSSTLLSLLLMDSSPLSGVGGTRREFSRGLCIFRCSRLQAYSLTATALHMSSVGDVARVCLSTALAILSKCEIVVTRELACLIGQ